MAHGPVTGGTGICLGKMGTHIFGDCGQEARKYSATRESPIWVQSFSQGEKEKKLKAIKFTTPRSSHLDGTEK